MARRDGVAAQSKQVEQTIAGERRVLEERERSLALAAAEQRAFANKADTEAAAGLAESQRLDKMLAQGVVAAFEADAARAHAAKLRDEASAQHLKVQRFDADLTVERIRVERDLLDLRAKEVALSAQHDAAANDVAALEARFEATRIRAPISGVLGEAETIGVGAFVAEGATIATIVPDGKVRIVAEMLAAGAAGVFASSSPRAFDSTAFRGRNTEACLRGSNASGPRRAMDGLVKLVVLPGANPAIPLQHGLPGRVDVEIERIAARLALRLAGRWVDGDATGRAK